MIELPATPKPNSMEPTLVDMGSVMRGASGLRVDRPGNHYAIAFKWPRESLPPDIARTFTGRLQRAKREGIQIKLPLLVSQGSPGSPTVNGDVTNPAASIAVKGLPVGYAVNEGYWLTISTADGTAYLHSVAVDTVANGSGNATIQIEPPLRAPFEDGDVVELSEPFMQGYIASDNFSWSVDPERFTEIAIVVEEYK